MNDFDWYGRHALGLSRRFQDPFENGMWKILRSVRAKYRTRCGPETGSLHTGGLRDWNESQMKEPMCSRNPDLYRKTGLDGDHFVCARADEVQTHISRAVLWITPLPARLLQPWG